MNLRALLLLVFLALAGCKKPAPPPIVILVGLLTLGPIGSIVGPRPQPKEFQGPKGPEPTRYGDWERKGIASDF